MSDHSPDQTIQTKSWRRWAYALFLNFCAPGVGLMYIGLWKFGLVAFGLSISAIAALTLMEQSGFSDFGESRAMAWAGLFMLLAGIILFILIVSTVIGRSRFGPARATGWMFAGFAVVFFIAESLLPELHRSYAKFEGEVEVFSILSEASRPAVESGDMLFAVGFLDASTIRRGDLVVYRPVHFDEPFVGRVVGMPGDLVAYRNETLWLNGEEIPRTRKGSLNLDARLPDPAQAPVPLPATEYMEHLRPGLSYPIYELDGENTADNTDEQIVPDGNFFVLGDNRAVAADSRTPNFGTVPFDRVIGLAWLRFWSSNHGPDFSLLRPAGNRQPAHKPAHKRS